MLRHAGISLALFGLLVGAPLVRLRAADEPTKSSPHASLGILVEAGQGEDARVTVQKVLPDSPADKAGIKKGDVISRVDSHKVTDLDTLLNVLAEHKPGDKVDFQVGREGKDRTVSVTLGSQQVIEGGEKSSAASGERHPAFLGIEAIPTEDLTERLKKRLGVSAEQGLVVTGVVPESPASRAGLRHGDVITRVEDKDVHELSQLRQAIQKVGAGKDVSLELMRGDQKKEVKAHLEEAPVDVTELPGPDAGGPGDPLISMEHDRDRLGRLERRLEQVEKRLEELEGKSKSSKSSDR